MSSLPEVFNFLEGRHEGAFYRFKKTGDLLTAHSHEAGATHDSILIKGAALFRGPKGEDGNPIWTITVSDEDETPKLIPFEPGQIHEVVALKDNTWIVSSFTGSKR